MIGWVDVLNDRGIRQLGSGGGAQGSLAEQGQQLSSSSAARLATCSTSKAVARFCAVYTTSRFNSTMARQLLQTMPIIRESILDSERKNREWL